MCSRHDGSTLPTVHFHQKSNLPCGELWVDANPWVPWWVVYRYVRNAYRELRAQLQVINPPSS